MTTIMKSFVAAGLLLAFAATANAQVAEKKVLTLDGAKKVIEAVKLEARKLNAPGAAIAVVDDGGNVLALERLDGTFAAGSQISIGKARTAALFKRETKVLEDIVNKGRTAMTALPDSLFTPLQGGVPVMLDGQILGAVGVSGAASAQQDQELAVVGANALTNPEAGKAMVTYFEKEKVAAAFAKGAVLFDAGDKYMVHASRREKAGMVEVHEKDADIIYVLEGTATLVTGGEVIGSKTVAPGEIRGTEVKGGETRTISKGDVIIVPAGTPHWFKEVPGPLNYYVVKAR
ncbi:MAG TPA: heme-binding protein [Blastocatellia bacterium]|nr:heme-binding protein [Blastocatellia bacterium]HMV83098.1 heme-binding protein [Blastocatellia bacterium]HMX26619.1 heme-binding protein [Blastocatellia bacterium]HMY70836.1 heme-binding protein [Blastocatellia bacterium]HMZ20664.1 heme-binding protein [Blastocatellia bacterium]